jgi:hypothetical protein
MQSTPTARVRRGQPSAYGRLRRRHAYADGRFGELSWRPPTPTAPTFGRRRRVRPSASSFIPVVGVGVLLLRWISDTQCARMRERGRHPLDSCAASGERLFCYEPMREENNKNNKVVFGSPNQHMLGLLLEKVGSPQTITSEKERYCQVQLMKIRFRVFL